MYIFSIITSFFLLNTIFPSHVLAACPSTINTSDVTIITGDSCTVPAGFSYIIDKADTIESTVNTGRLNLSGGSITISNTSNLTTGSIIPSGGSIIIQNGGVIKVGNNDTVSYVLDADADGYAPSLNTIYTTSGTNLRRLALLNSTTLLDCYDNNANAKPGSTYCGTTNRGDGSFDYNCSSSSTKCGTIYNRSAGSQLNEPCKTNRCQPVYVTSYITATINCGQTGYVCTANGSACTDCDVIDGSCGCSSSTTYCSAASGGTQACQ